MSDAEAELRSRLVCHEGWGGFPMQWFDFTGKIHLVCLTSVLLPYFFCKPKTPRTISSNCNDSQPRLPPSLASPLRLTPVPRHATSPYPASPSPILLPPAHNPFNPIPFPTSSRFTSRLNLSRFNPFSLFAPGPLRRVHEIRVLGI